MAMTNEEFRKAVSYLRNNDNGDIQNAIEPFVDPTERKVIDEGDSNADITPDTPTLEQALIDANAEETTANTFTSNQQSIKDLQAIAKANAGFIASLMSWLLNADIDRDDTDTRYSSLLTLMSGQSAGVLNVFKSGLIAEENIDVDSIGALLLTSAQKRNVLRFARQFANTWAIVVLSS